MACTLEGEETSACWQSPTTPQHKLYCASNHYQSQRHSQADVEEYLRKNRTENDDDYDGDGDDEKSDNYDIDDIKKKLILNGKK